MGERGPACILSEEQISAFEHRLGLPLPVSYREFLHKYNGADPDAIYFQFNCNGRNIWTWIQGFKALYAPSLKWTDIEDIPEWKQGELPAEALEFAYGPLREGLWLFLHGPRLGQVWLKDYEACFEEGITEEQLYFVAPNFDKFLALLVTKFPDDAVWD